MNFVIKTPSRRVFEVVNAILLILFGIICLLPVWHVLCSSVSDPYVLARHSGVVLWPLSDGAEHPVTWYGYKTVFGNNNLLMGYTNTVFYCGVGAAISTILCAMGGFVLSRKGMLLKKYVMIMLTVTMFFHGGMIPTYLVVKMLHLLDTRWVMVIPGAVHVMNLVIIRTAIQGMPDSLEESARLDGAGNMTILFRIVIPLTKATVAYLALNYVLGKWNSYYDALIYLRNRQLYPLQMILREILVTQDQTSVDYDPELELYQDLVEYCTIVVAILPIFAFYPFILKYFTKGMMVGSLKG